MLSVSEARERILAVFLPVETEFVPLDRAAGRVLSVDVKAATDLPLLDNSSVDGFALKVVDSTSTGSLRVVAEIRAGTSPAITLQPGQAGHGKYFFFGAGKCFTDCPLWGKMPACYLGY